MPVSSIEEGLALLALNELPAAEIPELACMMLASGHDSRELAAVAGSLACEHPSDVRHDFERGLSKAGIALPDRISASHALKRHYAAQCVAGALAPYDAARKIVDVYRLVELELPPSRKYAGDNLGIEYVMGLFYSYADVPYGDHEAIRGLDSELKEACTKLAAPDAA